VKQNIYTYWTSPPISLIYKYHYNKDIHLQHMIYHSTTITSSTPKMLTSNNPAITAYKVYHLGQSKLDTECRRQTPDLRRIVCHASIVDSVRRWSRDLAEPAETVVVDSSSDEESDPFEDSYLEEDLDDPVNAGEVAIFDADIDDDALVMDNSQSNAKSFEINAGVVQHIATKTSSNPRRRPPPPPPNYEVKHSSWRGNRPIIVRETTVEVGEDD